MKFRQDINGLRSIAVVAVVLFHFNPSLIPGGFAGVDVFFVISGFLMTGIIFNGLTNRSFDTFKFYVARANRIIPALAVMCAILLVYGWFYLTPPDYKALGKHVASSLGFLSNLIYWNESGYFDGTSHEKWLLHTWSLSVEWQFYIIYPLILVGLHRFLELRIIRSLLIAFTLICFGISVLATPIWPTSSYFLLPTRAWEMLAGGLVFLFPIQLSNTKQKALEYIGLVLIVASYALISKNTLWPGHLALIPVLGTCCVLFANRQNSVFTSNFIAQALGKWSYSIYLWHWPIVVFGYFTIERWYLYGIPLSLLFGYLSYRYIESIRLPTFSIKQCMYVTPFWGAILLAIPASLVYLANGVNTEIRSAANSIEAKIIERYANYEMDPTGLFRSCNASIQTRETGITKVDSKCISKLEGGVFLWGDSHMGALSTGLRQTMPRSVPFSQLTSSGCAPTYYERREGVDSSDIGCNYSNDLAVKSIREQKPDIVIIGRRMNHEADDWRQTIDELKNIGVKKIILVGPFPQWQPSLPHVYTKRHIGEEFIHDHMFDDRIVSSNRYLQSVYTKQPDFIFIDMLAKLCKQDSEGLSCRATINDDELLAFDYGHLTVEGSSFVAERYVLPHILPTIDYAKLSTNPHSK